MGEEKKISRSSLIQGISELRKQTNPRVAVVASHVGEDEEALPESPKVFLISKPKTPKKDKKGKQKNPSKKKKKSGEESLFEGIDFHQKTQMGGYSEMFRIEEPIEESDLPMYTGRFDDVHDDIYDATDGSRITDSIIRQTGKNYSESKKKDPIEKEFADVIAMLYELLEDADKFANKLDKKYSSIEGNRTQGMSKFTSELIESIISSKSSKLQIIKEITSIRKAIIDIKYKHSKGSDEESSSKDLITKYMQSIMGQNVAGYRRAIMDRYSDQDTTDSPGYANVDYDDRGEEGDQEDFDEISRRLQGSDKYDPENDAYFKFEGMGVTVQVKRCVDRGTWEFVAVDQDGQAVPDYPLPSTEFKRMTFSSDGSRATDEIGMSYNLINYYSVDEPEQDE